MLILSHNELLGEEAWWLLLPTGGPSPALTKTLAMVGLGGNWGGLYLSFLPPAHSYPVII